MSNAAGMRRPSHQPFGSILVRHSSKPVVLLDLAGKILTANPSFAQLLGRDLAPLAGVRFLSLVTPENRAPAGMLFQGQRGPARARVRFQISVQPTNGRPRPLLASSEVLGEGEERCLAIEFEIPQDDDAAEPTQPGEPSFQTLFTLARQSARARDQRELLVAVDAALRAASGAAATMIALAGESDGLLEVALLDGEYRANDRRRRRGWPRSVSQAGSIQPVPLDDRALGELVEEIGRPVSVAYELPLRISERLIGCALLLFGEHHDLTSEERSMLLDLATVSAPAIDMQRSSEALASTIDRERRLRQIVERLSASLSLDDVLDAACQGVYELIPNEFTAITTVNPVGVTIWRSIVEDPELRNRVPSHGGTFPTPDSVAKHIATTNWPVYLRDFSESTTPTLSAMAAAGLRSLLATPIPGSDGPWGVLDVARNDVHAFSDRDMDLLSTVADILGSHLQNVSLYESSLESARDLVDIQRISRLVVNNLDAQQIVNEVVNLAPRVVDADGASIRLLEGDEFVLVATAGTLRTQRSERIHVTATEAGRLLDDPQPLFVRDLHSHPTTAESAKRRQLLTRGWAAVPLLDEHGQLFGFLSLRMREPHTWTERERRLLMALATSVSQAYRNARAFESTRQVWRASIESLIAAIEARDHDTFDHSRQVALLARQIAQECDVMPADIEQIELAALLHDIGKIGVPDQILLKPAQLSTEESQRIRSHSVIGEQILAGNVGLAPILPLVRHHHERWDGTGYPDGLAGADIPFGAAILAVADALATMISSRPYRQQIDQTEALAKIKAAAGTQFHPRIVENLLEGVRSGRITIAKQSALTAEKPDLQVLDTASAPFDTRPVLVLHRVASEIRNLVDLPSFTANVTRTLSSALGEGDVMLYLLDEASGDLILYGSTDGPTGKRVAMGEGLVGDVAQSGAASSASNVEGAAEVAVPITISGSVIGVLAVISQERMSFGRAERLLLQSTADLLASTLQTARLHDEFHRLSHTDPLTDLGNHRAFYAHLDSEITRARATGSKLALLLLDINHLKSINDTLGHLAGDEALRQIARVLETSSYPTDLVYRYGGDEFALILPASDLGDAQQRIERLDGALQHGSFAYDESAHRLPSGSWGIAIYPTDGSWASELVNVADMRMYQSKRPGMARTRTMDPPS